MDNRLLNKRVGTILSLDKDKCNFIGYGVLVGTAFVKLNIQGLEIEVPTPEIKLDSGETVYGYQCWFASEEEVKEMLSNFSEDEIINVDVKSI